MSPILSPRAGPLLLPLCSCVCVHLLISSLGLCNTSLSRLSVSQHHPGSSSWMATAHTDLNLSTVVCTTSYVLTVAGCCSAASPAGGESRGWHLSMVLHGALRKNTGLACEVMDYYRHELDGLLNGVPEKQTLRCRLLCKWFTNRSHQGNPVRKWDWQGREGRKSGKDVISGRVPWRMASLRACGGALERKV